jgi:hypothetical protein
MIPIYEKERDVPSALLTRCESAVYLRLSLRGFDRHVRDFVPCIVIGTRVLYEKRELDQWLENQKVGPCKETSAPVSSSCSFESQAGNTDDRQDALTRLRRRARQRGSTRKS